MLKRSFTPGLIAAVAALLVGGFAVATESPFTGSSDPAPAQESDDQSTTQNETPFDEHPGQGSTVCKEATAHALETLMGELEAGEDVQGSIDEIMNCGSGADDVNGDVDGEDPPEGVNQDGPPDWAPGPPPWAGTEDGVDGDNEGDGAGPPEGVDAGGPPDWAPGPPPWAGTDDTEENSENSENSDAAPPEGVNAGGPPEWVPGPPPHAGTGDDVDSDGEDGDTGPPDWIPGPPPWAGEEEDTAQP